jgi:hypothetical protein
LTLAGLSRCWWHQGSQRLFKAVFDQQPGGMPLKHGVAVGLAVGQPVDQAAQLARQLVPTGGR